jgi:4-alpha-glucanotransferase
VPGDLPVGHHLLTLDFEVSGVSVPLLVAPQVFPAVPRPGIGWGLGGQTHRVPTRAAAEGDGGALQSDGSDLADLAELVSWVGADLSGDFVLWDAGPRTGGLLHSDPQRIRPEQVPEHAGLDERGRALVASGARRDALRALYAVRRSPRRQRAFESFCVAGGQPLLDHATWLAIAARRGPDPRRWDASLRDAGSEEVTRLRESQAEEVNFHRWCQWVADEQLAEAAREAARSGMGLGLVTAVHAPGAAAPSEAWSLGSLPVKGVRVGRPPGPGLPDGAVGQAAPWSPALLRDLGFAPLMRQLDLACRHAAGVVLREPEEWFRQWWVPEGLPAAAGAWVAQDSEALLAAVGIAVHRQGAVVMVDADALDADALDAEALGEPEARWLLAQGVLPLADAASGATASAEAARATPPPVRWVDVAQLADGDGLSVESLAASPAVRRRARRLTR